MITTFRHQNSLRHELSVSFLAIATLIACGFTISGQTPVPPTREIVAEDFTKNRPKGSPQSASGGASNSDATAQQGSKRRVYRLASRTTVARRKALTSSFQQLGITLWRLRPAKPGDTGVRMAVIDETKPSEWIPERIEANTPINFGDRVRITFESPRAGYLYIVDRDLFADGSMGDAMLIFPTLGTRGGDNQVRPGKLIDIPAEDDRQGYFTAKPVRNDQVGEVLSIIVTSAPLNLPISELPVKIQPSQVAHWETAWAAPVERFEMVGGPGQPWTENEKLAAATSIRTRQLTQEGPAPQTIYRLIAKRRDAVLVSLRLNYSPSRVAN